MARLAVLSDIHGNAPALQAVVQELHRAGITQIVLCGDVIQGPLPRETLDLLAQFQIVGAVMGNADREVLAHREGNVQARWVASQLILQDRASLEAYAKTVELDLPIGRVLFCHGTPRSDEEILTPLTPDADVSRALAGVVADVVVGGHIHMQYDRKVGPIRLVNTGSVGMPYEDHQGAYWLELGEDITFNRTSYDVSGAAAQLRRSAYPDVDTWVREYVEDRHRRQAVMEFFESRRERGPA